MHVDEKIDLFLPDFIIVIKTIKFGFILMFFIGLFL